MLCERKVFSVISSPTITCVRRDDGLYNVMHFFDSRTKQPEQTAACDALTAAGERRFRSKPDAAAEAAVAVDKREEDAAKERQRQRRGAQ